MYVNNWKETFATYAPQPMQMLSSLHLIK